jgi:hypothetical protein
MALWIVGWLVYGSFFHGSVPCREIWTDLRGQAAVWGEGQLPEYSLFDSLLGTLDLALLQLLKDNRC